MKFKNMHYPVLIAATNVRKLNSVKLLETGIRIGASVTLSKLADVLSEAISQYEGKVPLCFSTHALLCLV